MTTENKIPGCWQDGLKMADEIAKITEEALADKLNLSNPAETVIDELNRQRNTYRMALNRIHYRVGGKPLEP